jgi:curved DNA-binding protein CbpA
MQYHPDTKPQEFDEILVKAHQAQFVQVAEAYGVLSKPECKQYYDMRRSLLLGRNVGSASVVQAVGDAESGEDRKIVSESYNTQRMNFSKVQGRASSNWRDLQDKYKTEKWQNMGIPQRKLHRSAKVYGVGSSMFKMIAPVVFLTGLTYSIFAMGK